ncbi:hypothetical protein E1292_50265, partial [Nonomuraea deserti]
MTHQDAPNDPPHDAVAPVAALVDACRHFATHVRLLADRLGVAELSDDDVQSVHDAVHQVFTAAGLAGALATGLQRHTSEQDCPHYNVLTDAEWAPLAESGRHERKVVYGCELQPGHAGAHAAHVQLLPGLDRSVWIRWDIRSREFVTLPPCPAERADPDP